jgi:hypothetical protein
MNNSQARLPEQFKAAPPQRTANNQFSAMKEQNMKVMKQMRSGSGSGASESARKQPDQRSNSRTRFFATQNEVNTPQ